MPEHARTFAAGTNALSNADYLDDLFQINLDTRTWMDLSGAPAGPPATSLGGFAADGDVVYAFAGSGNAGACEREVVPFVRVYACVELREVLRSLYLPLLRSFSLCSL